MYDVQFFFSPFAIFLPLFFVLGAMFYQVCLNRNMLNMFTVLGLNKVYEHRYT